VTSGDLWVSGDLVSPGDLCLSRAHTRDDSVHHRSPGHPGHCVGKGRAEFLPKLRKGGLGGQRAALSAGRISV
jgi:hypothetical protein